MRREVMWQTRLVIQFSGPNKLQVSVPAMARERLRQLGRLQMDLSTENQRRHLLQPQVLMVRLKLLNPFQTLKTFFQFQIILAPPSRGGGSSFYGNSSGPANPPKRPGGSGGGDVHTGPVVPIRDLNPYNRYIVYS